MYVKYNAVLRGQHNTADKYQLSRSGTRLNLPADLDATHPSQHLWDKFVTLCKRNMYTTTLHAINSCVVKLGKLTKVMKVYRGLSGDHKGLPKQMTVPNEHGVKGGVEFAFMSTTTKREVALKYSRDSEQNRTIYEIQMGMVDRGADLKWMSQYPFEEEILFAPLTGIDVQGTRAQGDVLVVDIRLSINLNNLTLEQVAAKMQRS